MARKMIAAFIVIFTFVFAGEIMAKEIVFVGSTTVQKRVLEPAKAGIKESTGFDVKVRGIGSGGGFKELMEDKVPASIASSPLASLLKKNRLTDDGTYQEHMLIEDVIVPIVHRSNMVKELTWEQLSDINAGKITNWKEVGGADRKIIVVTSHAGSATRSVFQKKIMNKTDYVKGVRQVKSTRQEVNLVSKFKGGIGAVSKGFVDMNPRKVNVIKTKEISRPLSIITKGDPNPDIKAIIKYLRSPDASMLYK